jgi:hypothetical protein
MFTLVAALLGIGLQASPVVALPSTPQGRQLDAFVKALRTSEAAFVTFQADNMLPKRTPEQHKTMFAFEKVAPYRITDLNVEVNQ